MNLTSYRWVVLAASCLVNLCIGSFYAWSVFATPMAEHLALINGSEPENLSVVFTVTSLICPTTMILGGIINDRVGPRWLVLAGGLVFGGGMFLTGFATSPAFVILSYGVCLGLGDGFAYGSTVANSVKFFPDRPGLAGGAVTASYGISSVIVPLIASALIDAFSVTAAFKILGAGMIVIIGVSALFIRKCPEGFAPDGWVPERKEDGGGREVNMNWSAMIKSPVFFIMIAMFFCCSFSGLMIISQASPLAQSMTTMGATAAAVIVSAIALFNTAGRFVAGALSDRIGIVNTLRIVFVGLAAGMGLLCLAAASAEVAAIVFPLGVCVVGFCFGSTIGIYPGFTAAQFGMAHNSVNYGIMFLGYALAGLLGPTTLNALSAQTGTFQTAFIVAVCLALLSFALTFAYRAINARARAQQRKDTLCTP